MLVIMTNNLMFILLLFARNRFKVAKTTAATIPGLCRISDQTVRNRLHAAGMKGYRACVRIVLRPHHRRARLTWTQLHSRWSRAQWSNVVFSDESRFCLQQGDGRIRVWRRKGERYADNCIREQDRHRGGSVMVWGCIDMEEKSDLVIFDENVTAAVYLDQVINPEIVPLFQRRNNLIFMQDNARPHTARITTQHLTNLGIPLVPLLPCPATSPDLNPMEHLWDMLERRIRNRPRQPETLQELTDALIEEWGRIPREQWRKLIVSMRKRCIAVIDADGGHTRY